MNSSSGFHLAWLNGCVLAVSLAQLVIVGYWWRRRTLLLPLVILGGAAMTAVWSVLLFFPIEHSVVVSMPPGPSGATTDTVARIVSVALITGLIVGINQLLLLAVRRWVNRKRQASR